MSPDNIGGRTFCGIPLGTAASGGHICLDYTGAGLPAQAQLDAHAEPMRGWSGRPTGSARGPGSS
jgi:hypothetical protein